MHWKRAPATERKKYSDADLGALTRRLAQGVVAVVKEQHLPLLARNGFHARHHSGRLRGRHLCCKKPSSSSVELLPLLVVVAIAWHMMIMMMSWNSSTLAAPCLQHNNKTHRGNHRNDKPRQTYQLPLTTRQCSTDEAGEGQLY